MHRQITNFFISQVYTYTNIHTRLNYFLNTPHHTTMLVPLLILTLILLLSSSSTILAQSYKNISLGSSLTTLQDNSPWTSPSGDFALGFQKIEDNGFLLAIWFNKIPERTIVWYAAYQPYGTGSNLVANGSKVELTTDGQFSLKDPNGKQIWNLRDNIDHVALLDTGNLLLVDSDSVIRWQSFDHPTDTLLPGQILLQESGKSSRLVSRYQEKNFTGGRFQFNLQGDGNLVLYTQYFPQDRGDYAYWSTEVFGSNFRWEFNLSGDIFLRYSNGTIIRNISSSGLSTKDFYQRAVLEYDGVFKHYVYPKNSSKGSWSKNWTIIINSVIPTNICLKVMGEHGGGACGFNSYCTYDDRKRCHCPTGFSFIDPNDVMRGCKQDFVSQSCDESPLLFDLIDMVNTDWVGNEYGDFQSVNEDWCRQACLDDCFCAAIVFKDGNCWPKRYPLSNGRQDSSVAVKSFIKIRKDNSTLKVKPLVPISTNGSSSNSKILIIGSVLLGTSGLLIFLFILIACLATSHFGYRSSKVEDPSHFITDMNLRQYTYEELSKATNGFNEELGQGAFATVYKGVIPGHNEKLVAVKKLDSKYKEIDEEFKAEVSAISQTNHRNLVQLIGFCDEGEKRLLVYEFMSNGSLAGFLFGAQRPRWYQRKEIALEIARGLSYLHDECRTQIIHCDIKPQNILLDSSYMARISDFGLAKLLKLEQTRTNTAIRGTKGYVAPEWFKSVPVNVKVDVYSYGILLLELICCKKNFDANAEEDDMMILSDWVCDSFKDGNVSLLVEDDREALDDMKKVGKFVMTAIWCIQEDPSLRPTMKKVLLMLEGSVDVPIPPDPASFYG